MTIRRQKQNAEIKDRVCLPKHDYNRESGATALLGVKGSQQNRAVI